MTFHIQEFIRPLVLLQSAKKRTIPDKKVKFLIKKPMFHMGKDLIILNVNKYFVHSHKYINTSSLVEKLL